MNLLKKLPASNSLFAQVIYVIIIAILVSYMGYTFGKCIWYVLH